MPLAKEASELDQRLLVCNSNYKFLFERRILASNIFFQMEEEEIIKAQRLVGGAGFAEVNLTFGKYSTRNFIQ